MLLVGPAAASAETYTVTNGADNGAGSLRQAIDDAENNANEPVVDRIRISFTGNINLAGALPIIQTPVTITGTGASNVKVRRDPAQLSENQFRIFSVVPDVDVTVTIENLSISGARASGFAGGGLIMSGLGNLTIDSVVFSDNQSDQGGAISYNKGFTSIRNSTLVDNEAPFGAGILASSFGSDVGTGEVVNSTITGNTAADFGGGIYVGTGEIQVVSSTIVGNVGASDDTGGGGGTYSSGDASALSVANTLYAENEVGSTTPVDDQCDGAHTSFGYNLRETGEAGCTGLIQTGDSVDPSAAMLGPLGSNGGPTPTFALQAGNFAIDHGNNVLAVGGAFPACRATDQRGFFRTGAAGRCDIGAFERDASSPSAFSFGKLKRNLRRGTAKLTLVVPGPGTLTLRGNGVSKRRLVVGAAGKAKLPVKSKGRKERKLDKIGKVQVTAKVAYKPADGSPNTRSKRIKLIKRL